MWLDGHGYYDQISQYEISMTETQERLLQQALEERLGKNIYYQGIPYDYHNCASFATTMLNAYSGIDFVIKDTPDTTKSYFDDLAQRGVVKKLTTIYPREH
jgi:hypothetical protein